MAEPHVPIDRVEPTSREARPHARRPGSSPGHARGLSSERAAARAAAASRAGAALPLAVVTEGMVVRRLSVAPADVVFVKGVVEASDGLAAVFADAGGELTIAAPLGRERELGQLVADLAALAPVLGGAGADRDVDGGSGADA